MNAVMLDGDSSFTLPAAQDDASDTSVHGGEAGGRSGFHDKLRLVSLLLGQSPTVLRIARSGHEQAREELAVARAAYRRAVEESQAGCRDIAVVALDDAFRRVISAAHMASESTPASIGK